MQGFVISLYLSGMKHLLFISLLFLLAGLAASHAQPYQPMLGDSTTIWNLSRGIPDCYTFDSLYTTGEDTTINGETYKVVNWFTWVDGGIREDTITGKAWYRTTSDTSEYLIMDLALNVGDSFLVKDSYQSYNVAVDSVYLVSGKKHIRLDHWLYMGQVQEKLEFIEGTGPTAGILYQTDYGWNYNYNNYLFCHFKDTGITYSNAGFNGDCHPICVGIDEISKNNTLQIYPNPTSGIFTVQGATGEIQVFDLFGRLVLTSTEAEVDMSSHPTGIYMVRVGEVVRKLILR